MIMKLKFLGINKLSLYIYGRPAPGTSTSTISILPFVLSSVDVAAKRLNDYYLFYLSEASNSVNNEFIFTEDFEKIKKLIKNAPKEKKANWNSFKDFFEETSKRLCNDVKKNRKFIEFLLTRIN